jgi:hypothetical protein
MLYCCRPSLCPFDFVFATLKPLGGVIELGTKKDHTVDVHSVSGVLSNYLERSYRPLVLVLLYLRNSS